MRDLIIKYFFLNYHFKVFGKEFKVKRAATPTVLAFFIGVITQTIFDPESWLLILLCWVPFIIAIYLGFFYHRSNPLHYSEIKDWMQKYQYMRKPKNIGREDPSFPHGSAYQAELRRLERMHHNKFAGKDFVSVFKGLSATIILLAGVLIYILIQS